MTGNRRGVAHRNYECQGSQRIRVAEAAATETLITSGSSNGVKPDGATFDELGPYIGPRADLRTESAPR